MNDSRIPADRVDTGRAWMVAVAALVVLATAQGAPLVTVVAMKPIAASLDATRSAPALANSLASLGSGIGGILMGWVSGRLDLRLLVSFGAVMIAAGLVLSASGGLPALYAGHAVLVGLLGTACMFSPIMAYVTRWFDRRRGSAIALVSSSQFLAGVVWPSLFQIGVARFGWRQTMGWYAGVVAVLVISLAVLFLRPPPEPRLATALAGGARSHRAGIGLPPDMTMLLLSLAIFCCCATMSMPMQHIVAFCSDIGIGPARGAAMLSVLLGCAFLSMQAWGWLSDRIGGLRTILFASVAQAVGMSGFLLTQDEAGLFAVSAAFGLGFSGLLPAYVVAIRALFPLAEVAWRLSVVMFAGMLGMAAGGWFAAVIYDQVGFYAPAFAVGLGFNLLNLLVILPLVWRERSLSLRPVPG